ncbi:hypothetical protein ACPCSE_29380 [Streptomyces cellulosae]
MADDGHREWVRQQRGQYTALQLPVPFLDGHERTSSLGDVPCVPEELDRLLLHAWAGAPDAPHVNAVMVACPVDLLPALAEYAETCMTQWDGRRDGLRVSAASTLATHVRHVIARETD